MATNTSSYLSQTLSANAAHLLKQKRARSQLSCTPCRVGKLKCDREKPHCDQCIKRSREIQCIFVPPPVKHKPVQNVKGRIRQLEELVVDLMNQNRTAQASHGARRDIAGTSHENRPRTNGAGPHEQPTPPSDSDSSLQDAQSMRTGTADASSAPQDDVDEATTPFGQLHIGKDEISYVGDSHWGAILNSISELKRDLDDDEPDAETGPQIDENPIGQVDTNSTGGWNGQSPFKTQDAACSTSGLGFLLGSAQALTKQQIIAAVPEKKVVDRLLSLWFNSPDPFKSVIHAPTFQDEYKCFWRDPDKTPTMWLGLLFAILSLASSFSLRDADPTSEQAKKVLDQVNQYHAHSAAAATLADFSKPKEYTLECLIIYAAGLRSNNAFVNVWLMIGLILRLALRMGYHRDAKHYPNITPFRGEMRRRTWSVISMIDVLISFQLGLPSMVKTIQSDCAPPRNLLDRDFDVNTTSLPRSRGEDELTPSSYIRAKRGLVGVFADAAELSHATVPPAYNEMMELDRQLETAKAAIPPLLQMPEITDLVTDPAEQLMCRFNLDLLYLKTKIVLHRRYMGIPLSQLSDEEQIMGIGRSRKNCTEAALRVLQHHHTIYTASQPGGQLESVKWYMGSISTHDFLLAAMIICLELSQQLNIEKWSELNPSGYHCPRRGAMMETLERSQNIWTAASTRRKNLRGGEVENTVGLHGSNANAEEAEHVFNETEKAARAIGVMVEKVRAQFPTAAQQQAEGTRYEPSRQQVQGAKQYWKSAMLQRKSKSPERESNPFAGMVSTYNWDLSDDFDFSAFQGLNGSSLPEALRSGAAPGSLRSPAANPMYPAANDAMSALNNDERETTLDSYEVGRMPKHVLDSVMTDVDFSILGEMLDFPSFETANSAPSIDWTAWDSTITGAEHGGVDGPMPLPAAASATGLGDVGMVGDGLADGMGVVDQSEQTCTSGRRHRVESGSAQGLRSTVPLGPSTIAFGPTVTWSDLFIDNVSEMPNGSTTGHAAPYTDASGPAATWSHQPLDLPGLPSGNVATDTTSESTPQVSNKEQTTDIDMASSLQDVDFSLAGSLQNYNRNGMYPATQADWDDWWRRKRRGMTPVTSGGEVS
ncbi:hypothetical protein LTR62_002256 [Meristemomyces frigidus]|uniref:Zn(2)-C6 fungal-type domain-containing protein n=1 Tax=Meristemomyces frigidus TaxID=1508187 RepID=A0AAN7TG67_9PEZI|nr:hypothetical protein LTR62_002256 [Meristemomyces frigidus]